MSALYLLLVEKQPVETAMQQLSLRYGHVRQAKTGVLDKFLETYRDFNLQHKTDFLTWARQHYDRDSVIASHKIFSLAEWFNTSLMHRE